MMSDQEGNVTRMLTVKEVADQTGYAPGYLRRLLVSGEVRGEKRGYTWFVYPEEVEKLKERRKESGR